MYIGCLDQVRCCHLDDVFGIRPAVSVAFQQISDIAINIPVLRFSVLLEEGVLTDLYLFIYLFLFIQGWPQKCIHFLRVL